MCEVGIEEVLVWRKYLSSFLGEIGTPPRWYPPYPAAHSGGLGLTGGEYMGLHGPTYIPTPSQSAHTSGILSRNPGLSSMVSCRNLHGPFGALVPSGDKSHTWQLQLDPQGTSGQTSCCHLTSYCMSSPHQV